MSHASAQPSGTPGPTVLVVDDDVAVVALCTRILQKAGCSVLSATGSSEALKICKGHKGSIDLLVTDLVLPPPEFSFASSENEFPHVHGHELAFRALRMRTALRVILMKHAPAGKRMGNISISPRLRVSACCLCCCLVFPQLLDSC